ncbi:MAG: glutamyl-tRNA reductase [Dehalococcoidia bacterium]|nr:glutamyl-tRNA reductase [Dehalococcoidia bacterium]
MRISLVGINHQTAPVTVREKVAISTKKLCDALPMLRSYISRGIILSTCNRTEIYTFDSDDRHVEKASLDFLKAHLDIPDATLLQYVYLFEDRTAVGHLFRVASGLESMIVGEFEVLGQVGHALEVAERAGMVNLPLRHIFQSAIRTGRRVREETGISRNALSVSSVAVDLAVSIVGGLKGYKMLVIGAGEAGRLVAKVAKDRGISHMVVVGRTRERASALAAQLGGTPISPSNLGEELLTTNIVVTCAGAPHRILSVGQVKRAIEKRPNLPLVIIDIAVPRNVEPAVGQIRNVFLYNIDDLTELSNLNRKQRENEIHLAREIIASELDKFASWWQEFKVRPLIRAMMSKAEAIRCAQVNRTLRKLRPLSDEERDSLDTMTRSIVTKILNDPIQYLKANGSNNYAEMLREIFRLDEEN